MFESGLLKKIQNISICILAYFIPYNFIFSTVATILLLIFWIVQVKSQDLRKLFIEKRILVLWMVFYGLHLISYLYSTDKEHANFDLQVKLSMLIFPLIIGSIEINKRLAQHIFLSYTCGITTVSLFYMSRAVLGWQASGDTSSFFYHTLVSGSDINAVYMSWYVVFSIGLLMFYPWSAFNFFLGKQFRIIILILQMTFLVLLSSRLVILVFAVVVVPAYIFNNIHIKKISPYKIALIILIFLGTVWSILVIPNPIKDRYKEIFNRGTSPLSIWTSDNHGFDASRSNNLSIRFFIWKVGLENMRDHNLWLKGAGIGDVYELQNEKFRQYDVYRIDYPDPSLRSELHSINLHNMFLQCLLMLGIPGFILFSFLTTYPLSYFPFLKKHIHFLIFHLVSIGFFLQEAALQTQAGTVYYILFSCIFYNIYYNSKKEKYI